MLEKTEHMVILIDFYGPLLTDKQQYVLNLYYENGLVPFRNCRKSKCYPTGCF